MKYLRLANLCQNKSTPYITRLPLDRVEREMGRPTFWLCSSYKNSSHTFISLLMGLSENRCPLISFYWPSGHRDSARAELYSRLTHP